MNVEDFKSLLLAEGYSQSTIKTYLALVNQYLQAHAGIDKQSIVRYLGQLKENGCSQQKLRMSYYALSKYYKFITGHKLDINPPKNIRAPIEALTPAEARRLINEASENPRDKAIIEFLIKSGLRISELIKLKPEDIDTDKGIVYVKYGKGSRHRKIPCDACTLKEIKRFLPISIKHRQIQKLIKIYARRARIQKKVTPHILRHTYATILLNNGADIYHISKLLGHRSIRTTIIYLDVKDSDLHRVYRDSFRL